MFDPQRNIRLNGVARAARLGQIDAAPPPLPNFTLLAHRFETLEPRPKRIETLVTSSDFELHRGFRSSRSSTGRSSGRHRRSP